MAATFNRELVRRSCEISAYETKACCIPWTYAPVMDLGPSADKEEQARRVFDALREFDHEAVTEIYAQCPDTAGLGLAVANRLKKAAGFHVIEV